MPLIHVQAQVLKAIAANRSPESYLAGATVLHRDSDTPRFSQDLDLLHNLAESVARCAEADAATLQDAGYELRWLLRTPAFYRAVLSAAGEQLQMEWAQGSAYRFSPVQEDEQCGYCLHHADAAENKILALAGRQEIRDFVDILHLHDTYLHLGAMAWAACGQDPQEEMAHGPRGGAAAHGSAAPGGRGMPVSGRCADPGHARSRSRWLHCPDASPRQYPRGVADDRSALTDRGETSGTRPGKTTNTGGEGMHLKHMRPAQIRDAVERDLPVILPIGCVECHR